MARKRGFQPAALSFLDTLSNGFGAIVLLFVVISARSTLERELSLGELPGERSALEAEFVNATKERARTRQALLRLRENRSEVEDRDRELSRAVAEAKAELDALEREAAGRGQAIAQMERQLRELEAERLRRAQGNAPTEGGRRVRSVSGEGQRQYLTGLRVGGKRILILVDRSASMLDQTVVNVIRARNLPVAERIRAPKWRRTVDTVDWLTAQLPLDSRFQIYAFNTTAEPVLSDSAGWLPVDRERLGEAVRELGKLAPEGGTSLHAAADVIRELRPRPDNVYLLVDGLPTQGSEKPESGTVTADERLLHFRKATRELPQGTAINVVLFPMEGDTRAAPEYWWLAQRSGGGFLVPSADWP